MQRSTENRTNEVSPMRRASAPSGQTGAGCHRRLSPVAAVDASRGLERFLNQQNIERYLKLLDVADDGIQRRQIENLLEEEIYRALELEMKRNPRSDALAA
jgi:hypothetical protein